MISQSSRKVKFLLHSIYFEFKEQYLYFRYYILTVTINGTSIALITMTGINWRYYFTSVKRWLRMYLNNILSLPCYISSIVSHIKINFLFLTLSNNCCWLPHPVALYEIWNFGVICGYSKIYLYLIVLPAPSKSSNTSIIWFFDERHIFSQVV